MSNFKFGERSERNLAGVHPQLVAVVRLALEMAYEDFTVVCGLRNEAEQAVLMAAGKSWTLNSRHLTGHAVDLAPWRLGAIPWYNKPAFDYIGLIMLRAAHAKGEVIECGASFGSYTNGEWVSKYDGGHFQLPWQMFPVTTA